MWSRLNALLDFVRERCPEGVNGRGYVDTAPILEGDLAAAAGLGWTGKNTLLITPGIGSWYFLGELLLDIPLAHDAPMGDHCGTCRRCLDACPTGAFKGPYELDARRCISYLTIELKGPIPRELRAPIGHRIYGCDVCQDVCPHNKPDRALADPALASSPGLDAPDLLELLALDDEGFRERFRSSPIKRAKRRGFLRNVCVALGNSGDRRAVPPLVRALSDHEPLIRGHAAWALGRLGGEDAARALQTARAMETDEWVGEEIAAAQAMAQASDPREV
jgi:epoxyqueuosine reductase